MQNPIHNVSGLRPSKILSLIIGLFIILSTFTIVGPGERGVVVTLGEVTGQVFDEGFHFKMPIVTKVVKMDVKVQYFKLFKGSAASKDGQSIMADIQVNYSLDPEKVTTIYQSMQKNYESIVMYPSVNDAIKQATAQYEAVALLVNRGEVGDLMKDNLKKRLSKYHINVLDAFIENVEFSASYSAALEEKTTVEQQAITASNKIDIVKAEAEQTTTRAKAEAEAIRIQAEAISKQGGSDYVKLKAIEKWDGRLPVYSTSEGSGTFFNLPLNN